MKRSRILLAGGLGAALTAATARRRRRQPRPRSQTQMAAPAASHGKPTSAAPGPAPDHPDDVLAVLHADHIRLREMVANLQARPDGRLEEHRGAVRQLQRLIIEATGHEAVEELHLWPVVRARLPDGGGLADTACEQELEHRKLLQRLDRRRPGDVDFDNLVNEFGHRAASHIAYEETMVWPGLRERLGRHERLDLGRQIMKAKRQAPTRPHPSVPGSPGRHPMLGRSLALLDRNLDRLTTRGR